MWTEWCGCGLGFGYGWRSGEAKCTRTCSEADTDCSISFQLFLEKLEKTSIIPRHKYWSYAHKAGGSDSKKSSKPSQNGVDQNCKTTNTSSSIIAIAGASTHQSETFQSVVNLVLFFHLGFRVHFENHR